MPRTGCSRIFQSAAAEYLRAYQPELVPDVIADKRNLSPILDMAIDVERVPAGYAAMDERSAIKGMMRTL